MILSDDELEEIKIKLIKYGLGHERFDENVIEKLIENVENLKDLLARESRYRRGYVC